VRTKFDIYVFIIFLALRAKPKMGETTKTSCRTKHINDNMFIEDTGMSSISPLNNMYNRLWRSKRKFRNHSNFNTKCLHLFT